MLCVFTGSDSVATRARAEEFLDARLAEGSRAERLTVEDCTRDALRERASAQSLFAPTGEGVSVFVLDLSGEGVEACSAVVAAARELAESPHLFALIFDALPASDMKMFREYASEYREVRGTPAAKFNIFSLADALARRDRKSLWVLLMRARRAGLSGEEIVGTLFWQVKTMRLAARAKSASEAGLKPFPYEKAKRGARNFSEDELAELSRDLIILYHDAHLGLSNLDLALERWVLGV